MAPKKSAKTEVRAGCYLRISSDPKDKREGVERQRQDTTTLCEVKEWTPVEFYIDNDRSASSGVERPEWDRLLADVKAGKIDAIAAWDQDRAWRMMHELEDLRKFFTSLGRKVALATTGQGDIDLYSPTGVLAAQIKSAVSEHEIAMMKIRMRRAARAKAESGRPQWRQAFGYKPYTGRKEDDKGKRALDPVIAPLVKQGYVAITKGESLDTVAALWNDAGALGRRGVPWNQSSVSQFLRNPRNAGLRTHTTIDMQTGETTTGIVAKGTWTPLVKESLFRATVAALDDRPGGRAGARRAYSRHRLSGMMLCGKCGTTMCGSWVMEKTGGKSGRPKAGQVKESHPGTVAHSINYVCKSCRGVSIRARDLEPMIVSLIGARLAQADAADLLKAEIHDVAEAQRIRDAKKALYARIDEFAVERAQGLMDGRQLLVATEAVKRDIDALERGEQDQERLRVFDQIPVGTERAVAAVEQLSPDRLRAVMGVLMTVTIRPAGQGFHNRTFNPDRVAVEWFQP